MNEETAAGEHAPADASYPAGAEVDQVLAVVFDGPEGQARLQPLLEQFDREVGVLQEDDDDWPALHGARVDWALCDAVVPGGGPGETWAWRVAVERPPGVDAEAAGRCARSVCGVFEVWPGDPSWARDRLSGLCLRILDPLGPWARVEEGPSALWEMRLLVHDDGARMARPPLAYPLELLRLLDERHASRFEGRGPSMQDLRRARLRWTRARKRIPLDRLL